MMKRLVRSLLLFAIAQLVGAPLGAAEPPAKYREGPWEDDIGYRQAVRVGNTLYVSGTVGGGAMPDAIREAYAGIEKTLRVYGLTFAAVVKENIHTTDIDALKANLAVRKSFYRGEYPAATWVQVQRLYEPGHVIEVEVIAVFPEATPGKSSP